MSTTQSNNNISSHIQSSPAQGEYYSAPPNINTRRVSRSPEKSNETDATFTYDDKVTIIDGGEHEGKDGKVVMNGKTGNAVDRGKACVQLSTSGVEVLVLIEHLKHAENDAHENNGA